MKSQIMKNYRGGCRHIITLFTIDNTNRILRRINKRKHFGVSPANGDTLEPSSLMYSQASTPDRVVPALAACLFNKYV